MKISARKATAVATSAAALVMSAAAYAADAPAGSVGRALGADDTVHCYGVHSCKGMADCATTENQCKGMNACKSHGFKAMKAGACLTKGGTIGDIK
ncbi:MAG: hypothetical protein KDE63_04515 [Novosphingobium sp.]|nr:hypothetical protein [Novosphingobium sp.]